MGVILVLTCSYICFCLPDIPRDIRLRYSSSKEFTTHNSSLTNIYLFLLNQKWLNRFVQTYSYLQSLKFKRVLNSHCGEWVSLMAETRCEDINWSWQIYASRPSFSSTFSKWSQAGFHGFSMDWVCFWFLYIVGSDFGARIMASYLLCQVWVHIFVSRSDSSFWQHITLLIRKFFWFCAMCAYDESELDFYVSICTLRYRKSIF